MEWKMGTLYSMKNGFKKGDDTKFIDGTNVDLIVQAYESAMANFIAGTSILLALYAF